MFDRPVRKAVFPVAGLGTRFLPATKAMPKEMLAVVDRPVIQHVVDEAREAGIEQLIFVTGRNKAPIEDYFDRQPELEQMLAGRGRTREIELLAKQLPKAGTANFTRQQDPLGLGHAVWCARELVGNEPFALILPDMITRPDPATAGGKRCLAQMLDVYKTTGGNIVAVEEVTPHEAHKFGIVATGPGADPIWPITGMVEKPKRGTAPSNLYIMGRYILQPEIFALLSRMKKGAGGEIQITDAMVHLLESQPFSAMRHRGKTYDCGSKIGFLLANIAFGLDRPELVEELRAGLAELGA